MSIDANNISVSEDIQENYIIYDREITENTDPQFNTNVLVTHDHLSNRLYFNMYYTFDDRNLENKEISILWINANNEKGLSLCTDKALKDDRLVFAWNVPIEATKIAGIIQFAIRIQSEGYVWNSLIGTVEVKQGMITEEFNNLENAQEDPGWVDYIEGKYKLYIKKISLSDFNALQTKDNNCIYMIEKPDGSIIEYLGNKPVSEETSEPVNYNNLQNKPKINNVTLDGNLTSEDLNIPDGQYIYEQLDARRWPIILIEQFSKYEDKHINFCSAPLNEEGLLNLKLELCTGTIFTDCQDPYIPVDFIVILTRYDSYNEEKRRPNYDEIVVDEFTLFYKNSGEEEEEEENEEEQTLIDKLLPYICKEGHRTLIPVQVGDCICIEGRIKTSAECDYNSDVLSIYTFDSFVYSDRSRTYSRYIPPVPPAVAYRPSWADEDEENMLDDDIPFD